MPVVEKKERQRPVPRDVLLRQILTSRVYDVARETPLEPATRLSQRLSNSVLFKREDLQPIFSFKLRGAYNKVAQLSSAERRVGVITASAGNHAQGVAYSARHLGVRAVIVMPETTPEIKVEAVKAMGAEVILEGDNYSEAQVHCDAVIAESGLTFIHPFDDPLVIAGQGTIGNEIVRQANPLLSAIFVPVGGGGLIAGVGAYLKAVAPTIRIIGVQPVGAAAMHRSLKTGRRVTLDSVDTFADGVAVRQAGEVTFAIAQKVVDEIILVSNDEICAAIKDIFEDIRCVVEPAGALAVAGLKKHVQQHGSQGQHLAAILSGANMNFGRLQFVAERTEVAEAREALFAATIPERPGAFREFCAAIGRRMITEFNYRLNRRDAAHVFVGVSTQSRPDAEQLAAHLRRVGYQILDLSDDDIAKLHVRHMVGGRAAEVCNEQLCRFALPARPGALMEFLDQLGDRWNISLFHYRNHGADFGRVLAGFEVPRSELTVFEAFVRTVGYDYVAAESAAAYQLFLS